MSDHVRHTPQGETLEPPGKAFGEAGNLEALRQTIWACRPPGGPRWLAQVVEEGIAPLLHRFGDGLRDPMPAESAPRLRAAYYRTLASNLVRLDALRQIGVESQTLGVPVLLLKGAALVHSLYGDPGLRPMSDLDLLVENHRRRPMQALLFRLGYRPARRYPDVYRRGEVVVDLHTDAINRSRIRMRGAAFHVETGDLVRRSKPCASEPSLRLLDPVDHLLVLILHAFKHGFRRRIWLVDIAASARRIGPAGLPALRERAAAFGARHLVELAAWYIQERLDVRPTGLWLEHQGRPPLGLSRRFLSLAQLPGSPQVLEPVVTWRLLPSASRRIRYLLEASFPRPEVLLQVTSVQGRWAIWRALPCRLSQLVLMAFAWARQVVADSARTRNW